MPSLNSKNKLDLSALSKFEKEVLNVVQKIPKGKVVSYGQIAKKIGRPKSSRAVGNAVAKNPLAPKIPCHRVVKSDGSLGGYSGKGGVRGKIRLLKKEGIQLEKGKVSGVDFSKL